MGDTAPHTDDDVLAFLDACGSAADDGQPADCLGDVLGLRGASADVVAARADAIAARVVQQRELW